MNITSQNDRTILSTLNRNYTSSLKTTNNAQSIIKSQMLSAQEDSKDTTLVKQEPFNDMQTHFGAISQIVVKSASVRVPDIRKLTDKFKEEFSNRKVVSDRETAASNSNTVDESNSMSSEELMDSFVEIYSKNYQKCLAVFTRR